MIYFWFSQLYPFPPSAACQFCRERHDVPTCCKCSLDQSYVKYVLICVPSQYVGTLARSSMRRTTMSWRAFATRCATYVICSSMATSFSKSRCTTFITQVCKFPDKTRQRKTNLSDEEHAAAVISMSAWNTGYEDDEDFERRNPQQQQRRAPVSAGASTNAPNPGQMTLWDCLNSAPVQGFKRPNAHGQGKLALPDSKRAKKEHAKDERTTKGIMSTHSASTRTSSTGVRADMPPPLGKPLGRDPFLPSS